MFPKAIPDATAPTSEHTPEKGKIAGRPVMEDTEVSKGAAIRYINVYYNVESWRM